MVKQQMLQRGGTRRTFLGTLAGAQLAAAQSPRRPNILLAIADDWGWPFYPAAGDRVVKTPVFDRLAREGVLFPNAFVSAPSCSPSRAALLTGQWHWRLAEGANLAGTLPARFPTYPDLLAQAGYHAGFTRKGWGPGNDTAGGRTVNPAGPRYADFRVFLDAKTKDQPFCFWFGSQDPHRPFDRDSGVKSGLDPAAVRVPAWLPGSDAVRRDLCDYYHEVQRFDREVGDLLALLQERGELDNTIVIVTGDNGCPFPRAKATLYDAGTRVPLVVRWPSRFPGGRTVGDLVSLTDLAPTLLQAAGLPSPPGTTGRSLLPVLASRRSGRVDRARTHVLTGMERHVPSRGEGRGGYPMRALRTRNFLYIRNFSPDRWPAGDPNGLEQPGADPFTEVELTARTQLALADIDAGPSKAWLVQHRGEPEVAALYRLAAEKRPPQELYDLRRDPEQVTNVAGERRYAAELARLDRQLMAELRRTGDPRALGRGEVFESYPYRQR